MGKTKSNTDSYVLFRNAREFSLWSGCAEAESLGYNHSLAYKTTNYYTSDCVEIILQNGSVHPCSRSRLHECDDEKFYPIFKRGDKVCRKGSPYWFIVDKYHDSNIFPWLIGRNENHYIRQDKLEYHVDKKKPKYSPSIPLSKKVEIMSAALAGKPIEVWKSEKTGWIKVQDAMSLDWDWSSLNYRVAETLDTVDWNEVGDKFNYIARNKNGLIVACNKKPRLEIAYNVWVHKDSDETFSLKIGEGDVCIIPSFKKGSVDWDKSLITRPDK